MINYADYGIQIFLPDGSFFREIRLGGPKGYIILPMEAPDELPAPSQTDSVRDRTILNAHFTQLNALIKKLTTGTGSYLPEFINMVSKSLHYTRHAPGSYAETIPSVVGQPLALVNIGVGIELATAPLENMSTTNPAPPPTPIISEYKQHKHKASPELLKPGYAFPVKLGNPDRLRDGLNVDVNFLRHADLSQDIAATIAHYRDGIAAVDAALTSGLPEDLSIARNGRLQALLDAKVPRELAWRIASLPVLTSAPDIVLVASQSERPVADVAASQFVHHVGKDIEALFEHQPAEKTDRHFIVGDPERATPFEAARFGLEPVVIDSA